MIGIGIDTHKATLAVSAVDELGRELDRTTVRNDRPGHAALARWVVRLGSERRVGIEGSGGFGAALAQALLTAGESVFEVPPTLTARERRRLRSHGKSDPADAIAIARVVAREGTLPIVREWTSSDDLRLIVTARDELLAERTRVADRLHADLLVLAPGYGDRIPNLVAARHLGTVARLLGRRREVRAQLARTRLARLRTIDRHVAEFETRLGVLVASSGSTLPTLPGIGVLVAAKLIGEVGDVRRLRSAAAFASYSGTAPVPASSGQTQRHRLDRGGNRQLDRALHTMALVQIRIHPPAQVYLARRTAEGKTWREATRCLKRHLADVVYRTMKRDLPVTAQGLTR